MEQRKFIKNISGSVCAIGVVLSTMNTNSTMVIDGDFKFKKASYSYYTPTTIPFISVNNVYEQRNSNSTRLMNEATALFGKMRDATVDEQESINKYIQSISKSTGVNFFDLC